MALPMFKITIFSQTFSVSIAFPGMMVRVIRFFLPLFPVVYETRFFGIMTRLALGNYGFFKNTVLFKSLSLFFPNGDSPCSRLACYPFCFVSVAPCFSCSFFFMLR